MLRGVIPTVVFKESVLTKVQKQQTCVWDSLTRAFNEVKMGKHSITSEGNNAKTNSGGLG